MIKKVIKLLIPPKIFSLLKNKKEKIVSFFSLLYAYTYDFRRYYRLSAIKGVYTSTQLISKIIREYHVIEKGLTMPKTRLGFGKDIIISLCKDCNEYIERYGDTDKQLKHAIGVIYEYELYHKNQEYHLEYKVIKEIELINSKKTGITNSKQRAISKCEYFQYSDYCFEKFSNSRASVRNFTTEDVPIKKINDALELSRSTPSACNRQGWRTYVYTNKEKINRILEIQDGNRGFGYLTNKLIIITEELGVFTNVYERNQAFIDGGIYAMNLLYSLHYNKIATCILNCSNTPEKDRKLRSECGIKHSEIFIAMIVCGIPPENFKIATSKRYTLDHTSTIID